MFIVTGVGGFIASALSRKLVDDGHEVFGIDDFSLGHRQNVPQGISFIEGNLSDPETYKGLPVTDVQNVLHLAGQSGGELSFSRPIFDLEANLKSTILLSKWMIENGLRRMTYASSVAVYGDAPEDTYGLEERSQPRPKSPYGITKLAAENYLRIFSQREELTATSLRLFNVFGPGQDLSRMNQGMVSIYLGQALRTGSVLVKGSLSRYRDFVYVDDVIDAFLSSVTLQPESYQDFNVCTGEKTTVAEVLTIISRELGQELDVQLADETPGDVNGWRGDPSKFRKASGWHAEVPLAEGIARMISHAKNSNL